jgi:hypothetical protein
MLIKKIESKNDLIFVRDSLNNLRNYYSNFNEWFDKKVLTGHRFVFVAYDKENFAGCLILKKDENEKKICTLFVREENLFDHIGGDFLQIAYDTLQTDKLPISISDEVKEEFFNSRNFNFVCEKEKHSAYKENVTEYFGYIRFHENYPLIQFMKRYWKGKWHIAVLVKENVKELEKKLNKKAIKTSTGSIFLNENFIEKGGN